MIQAYRHLPPLAMARAPYAVRCIAEADFEPIRQWRNAQIDVLRQPAPISPEEQQLYFRHTIRPQMDEHKPDTILVAILCEGERIGYGGLVHCAWEHRRAEISVLFAPEIASNMAVYCRALLAFLDMICELGFARLGFNRLTLETYATREAHIALLEEAGFRHEGRLREHVMIDGSAVDSLIHARLASDYASAAGGRITSRATRSIRVPASGAS